MQTQVPTARLARRVHFSCGHRYFQPQLSEDENKRVYGSLYARSGFGHNYILEATFEGPIDPVTGMVVNLKTVDEWLKKLTEPLDHHFLNEDVAYFKSVVPSTENIAAYCYEKLKSSIPANTSACLFKVRLIESDDVWVDYSEREDAIE